MAHTLGQALRCADRIFKIGVDPSIPAKEAPEGWLGWAVTYVDDLMYELRTQFGHATDEPLRHRVEDWDVLLEPDAQAALDRVIQHAKQCVNRL